MKQIALSSLAFFALLGLTGVGCSDSDHPIDASGGNGDTECASASGPVAGPADSHCRDDDGQSLTQTIGMCRADGGDDVGAGGDGGADEEYQTLYGFQGYDDDCKYGVLFENSCVALNQPVTFKVTLTRKSDGAPATGATPDSPEIFLLDDPSHISPSNNIKAPESPSGVYSIGPIVFDRSGRWVVRFHFFEECSDVPEDSPHGHAAFYIDVP